MKNPFSPLALLGRFTIGRFFIFRKELLILWKAFRHADTPFYLKAAMLAVPLYLVSPIDIIPDFIPFLGVMDDFIVIPLIMGWIVSRLPIEVTAERARAHGQHDNRDMRNGSTIDGRARRM